MIPDNSPTSSAKCLEVQVDGQTPESWGNLLARFSDATIYQTYAYGAVRWGARNLSHLVLRSEDEVVAAAQLRIARLPVLRAGVAYLRWGPLIRGDVGTLDSSLVRMILRTLREEYCVRRGLTLQIIPNAFPGHAQANAFKEAFLAERFRADPGASGYRTVLVDLTPEPQEMRKRLDQKWRNQLNGSEKNGIQLEVGDTSEAYHDFLQIYEGMWERKRFETSVDVGEFLRIQNLLSGKGRMRIFTARHDGKSLGSLVFSQLGDTAIYLLGATNENGRKLKASYFLHWHAMQWFRERGKTCYDLGGVDPHGNPGGYHFKSGFGGEEVVQVPLHHSSGGVLSDLLIQVVSWLRHRRSPMEGPGVPGS